MTRLIIKIALLALLAAAAVWIANNPGHVSIAFEGYTVETSAGVLALAVLLLVGLAIAGTRLWRWLRKGVWESRTLKRHQRGYNELAWGLSALLEGDGKRAGKHAKKFEKLVGETALSDVLTGQAALAQGDVVTARQRFAALEGDRKTQALALRGLLAVESREGDRQALLGTAKQAAARLPKAEWAQTGLFESAIALKDWQAAEAALSAAMKAGRVGQIDGARQSAVLNFCMARDAHATSDADRAQHLARKAIGLDPDLIPARALLAELLINAGKARRAKVQLREAWRRAPHPSLARAWMTLTDDRSEALRYRHLLGLTDGTVHPETHAVLAAQALKADLPGPARSHIEALIAAAPQKRAYQLLETLETQTGNEIAAKAAADKALSANPDPAWHCDVCGHGEAEWTELCEGCGAFGTMHWGAPVGSLRPVPKQTVALPSEPTPLLPGSS